MSKAEIAIAISVVSASVSLGGLIWQLTLYWLSGFRLDVRLLPAIIDGSGRIVTGRDRGFRDPVPAEFDRLDEYTVDLAKVRVTNIGRAAVSISDIALDFGCPVWWRRDHRFIARGFPMKGSAFTTDDVVRLEPGASVETAFDFWSLMVVGRKRNPGMVRVRGTAQPAGRRARRSSWWRSWQIWPGQEAFRQVGREPADVRVYRRFWREVYRVAPDHYSILLAFLAARPIALGEEDGDLWDVLRRMLKVEIPSPLAMAVLSIDPPDAADVPAGPVTPASALRWFAPVLAGYAAVFIACILLNR